MNVTKRCIVGIDISKNTFNAHFGDRDCQYSNNSKGWKKFSEEIPEGAVCAMESTGLYYYRLASYLHSKGFGVKVLNPLWVKRYMQSLGSHAKTDKKDAKHIAQYADTKEVKKRNCWEPLPPKLVRAKMVVSLLSLLTKINTVSGNMNHAIKQVFNNQDKLLTNMSNVSDVCKGQVEDLEQELFVLVNELYPEKFRLLQTIPGIAAKTAAVMLVSSKGMEFDDVKQFAAWVGLAPSVYESGTSVRGKGRISKAGNPYLRALLYMCTKSAVRFCRPCKEMYNRLVSRGKSKLLTRVAVMHRMIKIAFGVVKSGEPFKGGKVSLATAPT